MAAAHFAYPSGLHALQLLSQIIADVCCDVAMVVQVPSLEELVHHINVSSSVSVCLEPKQSTQEQQSA